MTILPRLILLTLIAGLGLSGCDRSRGVGKLLNLTNTEAGPDEFAILPTKPLEMPDDVTTLPEPRFGGGNRVDPDPKGDAVAALGGNRSRLEAGRIGAGEGALVAAATRFGTTAGIRDTLAAEDREFRSRNKGRLLERLFNVNTYFAAYERLTLNAQAELARLRRLGVRTPAAPPSEE